MHKDANKDLVTKVDLVNTQAALKVDIADFNADLIKWIIVLTFTVIVKLSVIVFSIFKLYKQG